MNGLEGDIRYMWEAWFFFSDAFNAFCRLQGVVKRELLFVLYVLFSF
jgi:hypothetical protein